ncbi:MAG: DUF4143 domain-containing protein [Gammaproteobacteria bacterium]|nr:DUF4143 domain-containing protein [Gammaproteobacteria bacterium]
MQRPPGKKSRRKRWSGTSAAWAASSTWRPPPRDGFSMYRRICRDAGPGYETRRCIDVLEDTPVVFRIPTRSGSSRASLARRPRLLLSDIGVRNALLRRPLHEPFPDERGILLGQMVACELHRRVGAPWPEAVLFHYRTRSGAEVDFVLEVWGIEITASRIVDRRMRSGLS